MGVDQSNHPFAPRLPPGRPNNIQRVTVNEREQTGERQRERATERASFVRQSEQRDRTSRETERAEGQNEQRDRTSRETERAERQNEQRDRKSVVYWHRFPPLGQDLHLSGTRITRASSSSLLLSGLEMRDTTVYEP